MSAEAMDEDAWVRPLVELFYARVREDALLGPIFGSVVHDWSDHEARLIDFWSSVMLSSGRYKGNPVALHLMHADAMTPERFARWLALWRAASDELLPSNAAAAVQEKAARIAESLQLAIQDPRPPAA